MKVASLVKEIPADHHYWDSAKVYQVEPGQKIHVYGCGGGGEREYEYVVVNVDKNGDAEIFASYASGALISSSPVAEYPESLTHEEALKQWGYEVTSTEVEAAVANGVPVEEPIAIV